MTYTPAMEFASKVDFDQPIETYRSMKWADRVKAGDIIAVEKVHQRAPGRRWAQITDVKIVTTWNGQEQRMRELYGDRPQLVRIRLRVLPPGPRPARIVTWQTKTTSIYSSRRD